MARRSTFLRALLAALAGLLIYQMLLGIESRRAQAVTDQILEGVYLRALREFYELADAVRSHHNGSAADESGTTSLSAYLGLPNRNDWEVTLNTGNLATQITPASRPSDYIQFTFVSAGQRTAHSIDIQAWLRGLFDDIGFSGVAFSVLYHEQLMVENRPAEQADISGYLAPGMLRLDDFISPDLSLLLGRDVILESVASYRFVQVSSVLITILLYLFISLWWRLYSKNQVLGQELEINQNKVRETEDTLREQMNITANSHKELLKSHYELQSLNHHLERANNQIQFSERLANLGEMSAGIVHEINNPVAYIGSNLRELEKDFSSLSSFIKVLDEASDSLDISSDFYQKLLASYQEQNVQEVLADGPSRINDSISGVDRIRKIIQDMKRLSSSGGSDKKTCNINDNINSVVNIATSRIKGDIELKVLLIDLPDIYCNSSQISQVVTNILVNSIQALGDSSGRITLSESIVGEHIVVDICDNGPGMEKEVADRVFEPFFTTKDQDEGTGMGLSLCYKLISEHDGWIDLETSPGNGACFKIYLPLNHSEEDDHAEQ